MNEDINNTDKFISLADIEVKEKDLFILSLANYFITEKKYNPVVVHGIDDEIWLENMENDLKLIRINTNYIHNEEQYKFDVFKIKNIVKQIKKKTFSLKMKTMNILLDLNDDIKINPDKNIDVYNVKTIKDVRNTIGEVFPKLKTAGLNKENDVDMIVNITNDINEIDEWMPGDIVIFNNNKHIGIVSNYRNKDGVTYILHNGGQPVREEDYLKRGIVVAHYRFDAEKIPDNVLYKMN